MKIVFGEYGLDPNRRELTRGSATVSVGPQVFDVLLHLVRSRDRVVSKDDLIDVVWGGRIVSESTLTSHINAVRKALGDTGEEQRLIRTIARRGYQFVGEVQEADVATPAVPPTGAEATSQVLTVPEHPSIAVLPFLNLSGDSSQDYLVDGVVEDIIVALSRVSWLLVIARNSSYTYKGRPVEAKQVGHELGVRYVLEGSLRKAGNRIRITGQLVDAAANTNLWSERFEGEITDIFDLQDSVAAKVVGAIAPELQRAEIERAKRKPTQSLDAYDYYLRGLASLYLGRKEAVDEALRLFHKAIEADPEYAAAYGAAAWCYMWRKVNGWMVDRVKEFDEGTRLARRAVELGREDAVALTHAGSALSHFTDDLDGSLALLDRAKMLNPNLAVTWFLGGFVRVWRGDAEEAVAHFTQAIRLSPLDPEMFRIEAGMAAAHLFAKRFDEASSWAEKAHRHMPAFLFAAAFVAASHALAGRVDDARQAMQHLRRLDPALRLANITKYVPIRRAQDLCTISDGLRRAGLPE